MLRKVVDIEQGKQLQMDKNKLKHNEKYNIVSKDNSTKKAAPNNLTSLGKYKDQKNLKG